MHGVNTLRGEVDRTRGKVERDTHGVHTPQVTQSQKLTLGESLTLSKNAQQRLAFEFSCWLEGGGEFQLKAGLSLESNQLDWRRKSRNSTKL